MFNKNQVVAVVMGGPSAEREISLNTGKAIASALREAGYTNVVELDLDPKNFTAKTAVCRLCLKSAICPTPAAA